MNLHQIKRDIIEVGRRLYEKGYVVSNDGNISARISEDRIVITPSGLCKGTLSLEDLCICDMDGNKVSGLLRPSSEVVMHIFLYRERPDIQAIVHAHPPTATGFSVAGIPLTECVLPKVIVGVGSIPIARYGTPGGVDIAEPIRQYVKDYDAYLLENHGATTVGTGVMNAYFKMETMEHFARILLVARQLGGVNVLDAEQVDKLVQIRERMGLRGPTPACDVQRGASSAPAPEGTAPTPGSGSAAPVDSGAPISGGTPQSEAALVEEITRRVLEELQRQR